jgi:4'-phosphopantetheinyl transferase
MPLHKIINHNSKTTIYIWKIFESIDELSCEIILNEKSQFRLNNMKSEMHKRGFLSVRKLLQEANYSDFDLYYDQSGKPHLLNGKFISISHSHEMSAIIISDKPAGIDLEIQKEKVLKIAPKFMDICHIKNLSHENQIKKATIIWGIKETIFKIENQKGISFPDHIFEDDFQVSDKKTSAQFRFNNKVENFDINFEEIEDYILVWGFRK